MNLIIAWILAVLVPGFIFLVGFDLLRERKSKGHIAMGYAFIIAFMGSACVSADLLRQVPGYKPFYEMLLRR